MLVVCETHGVVPDGGAVDVGPVCCEVFVGLKEGLGCRGCTGAARWVLVMIVQRWPLGGSCPYACQVLKSLS